MNWYRRAEEENLLELGMREIVDEARKKVRRETRRWEWPGSIKVYLVVDRDPETGAMEWGKFVADSVVSEEAGRIAAALRDAGLKVEVSRTASTGDTGYVSVYAFVTVASNPRPREWDNEDDQTRVKYWETVEKMGLEIW